MTALDTYFLTHGFNQEDYVISNYDNTCIRDKDLFLAGYEAKNEYIQKRIEEITTEISSITDLSMSSGARLNRLRGIKKELKSLLVLE
jgi:hypothetical protein|nr:MAG TPA: early protein [Caudoviricetes sp.]